MFPNVNLGFLPFGPDNILRAIMCFLPAIRIKHVFDFEKPCSLALAQSGENDLHKLQTPWKYMLLYNQKQK